MKLEDALRNESLHFIQLDNDEKRLWFVKGVCYLISYHNIPALGETIEEYLAEDKHFVAEGLIEALNFYKNMMLCVSAVSQVSGFEDYGELDLLIATPENIIKHYSGRD